MADGFETALEAAGWRTGDAADFLGMDEAQRQLLDARFELAREVRRRRAVLNITQKDLAARMRTSQPRIAQIESAAAGVSFEQLFRAVVAVGGRVVVSTGEPPAEPPKRSGRRK